MPPFLEKLILGLIAVCVLLALTSFAFLLVYFAILSKIFPSLDHYINDQILGVVFSCFLIGIGGVILGGVVGGAAEAAVAIIQWRTSQQRLQRYAAVLREAQEAYAALTIKEALLVRNPINLAIVFVSICWGVWNLVSYAATTLLPSARASAMVDMVAATQLSPRSPETAQFIPPLGLPLLWFNIMMTVLFGISMLVLIVFIYKGYFATTKSPKAANAIEHFCTLVLGVFLGKAG